MPDEAYEHLRRSREYWDRAAATYDEGFAAVVGADLIQRLQEVVAGAVPPGDVVEFGCGTGLFTCAYAPRCRRVVATDLSTPMVATARRRLADLPQVCVQRADAAATALPARSADGVVVLNLLHIVAEPMPILAEARRLLRPGGMILAASVSGEGLPGWRLLRVGWRLHRRWGLIDTARCVTPPLPARWRVCVIMRAGAGEQKRLTAIPPCAAGGIW